MSYGIDVSQEVIEVVEAYNRGEVSLTVLCEVFKQDGFEVMSFKGHDLVLRPFKEPVLAPSTDTCH